MSKLKQLNTDVLDFKNYYDHSGNLFYAQTAIIIGFVISMFSNLFTNFIIALITSLIVLAIYYFHKEGFTFEQTYPNEGYPIPEPICPLSKAEEGVQEIIDEQKPDFTVIDPQANNPEIHPEIQKYQTNYPRNDYFTTTNEKAYQMTNRRGFINFVDRRSKQFTEGLKFVYGKSRRFVRF